MKLGDLLMPLRVAVTGSKVSPPLVESIRVMGVEEARRRTARAIAILEKRIEVEPEANDARRAGRFEAERPTKE